MGMLKSYDRFNRVLFKSEVKINTKKRRLFSPINISQFAEQISLRVKYIKIQIIKKGTVRHSNGCRQHAKSISFQGHYQL